MEHTIRIIGIFVKKAGMIKERQPATKARIAASLYNVLIDLNLNKDFS